MAPDKFGAYKEQIRLTIHRTHCCICITVYLLKVWKLFGLDTVLHTPFKVTD